MPNQPRYQVRGFRLPTELWRALQRIADDRGEPVTAVVIRFLWRGVRDYHSSSR